jgi:hypothetical protein
MKNKPIRVDWDELDAAFNNQNDEIVYYLDLVTGHVVLEGEGEEDDFDDVGEFQRSPASAEGSDSTRSFIRPVDQARKLEWMREFLERDTELAPEVVGQLTEALGAEDPAGALGDILRENAEARERWYVYRSDRIHELIERWLEEAKVTVVDPPPWK